MELDQKWLLIAGVCGVASLNYAHCEQCDRVFSCRVHSLLMLTRGQDTSQQELGKHRWLSVPLATQTVVGRQRQFQHVTSERWSNVNIYTCTCCSLCLFYFHRLRVSLENSSPLWFAIFKSLLLYLSLWETLSPQRDSFRCWAAQSTHSL